jgi:hypothetical protein
LSLKDCGVERLEEIKVNLTYAGNKKKLDHKEVKTEVKQLLLKSRFQKFAIDFQAPSGEVSSTIFEYTTCVFFYYLN